MTEHEKWLYARLDKPNVNIKRARNHAKNVLSSWYGLFKLSHHETNRLNIFNSKQ